MPAFRKKPVVITAVQFRGTVSQDLYDFLGGCPYQWHPGVTISDTEVVEPSLTIMTLEGAMNASPGDWIIRGIEGEYYPCKPDIFAKTYEGVPCDL